jgi:hypothetical protein
MTKAAKLNLRMERLTEEEKALKEKGLLTSQQMRFSALHWKAEDTVEDVEAASTSGGISCLPLVKNLGKAQWGIGIRCIHLINFALHQWKNRNPYGKS